MELLAETHPFPMIRGGGFLLISIGVGFMIGWLVPRFWAFFAIVGFVIGILGSSFSGLMFPSLGIPTLTQNVALIFAIVLEIILINIVLRRYADDERKTILAVLFVVGAHFLVMGISHGPWIVILGLICMINAWLGMSRFQNAPVALFGMVDSIFKIAIGIRMMVFFPVWM